MNTQKNAYVARFGDKITIGFPDTNTLYLTADMALRLSAELAKFANDVRKTNYIASQLVPVKIEE